MNNLKEQRFAVKFCVKLGKSTTETFAMLNTAYGDVAMKQATCFRWHKRFKNGRLFVEDDERSGRPSTTDDPHIDEINTLVQANRRLTVRELAEECGISVGSCHHILTEELKMHRVAAKFVPRLMTSDQQAHRVQVCQDLLDHSENDKEFLPKIITGDESWVYGCDVETKVQFSQWTSKTSPRPKKAYQYDPKSRCCSQFFFDASGVVHDEYLSEGSTVNQTYYIEVLKRLRDAIQRKRPELWRSGDWFFHHDNAPAHSALRTREVLAKHSITVLPHPPYSTDLAPHDFFLFPMLKRPLKGRFETIPEIKANATKELKGIKKEAYLECFRKQKHRWDKCVRWEGEYFERDPDL